MSRDSFTEAAGWSYWPNRVRALEHEVAGYVRQVGQYEDALEDILEAAEDSEKVRHIASGALGLARSEG